MKKKISGLVLSISIPIFILLTITQLIVQWDEFFLEQYQINGVVETTKIQLDELMNITDEIQDYLLGDREDFAIIGVIDGKKQQVFNDREIIHMEDVQELFKGGIILRNICGVLIVVIGFFVWKRDKKVLFFSMKFSSIGFISIGVILATLLVSNFDKYFNIFHEIFFRNNYWILDPMSSVLINMVNLNFFMNIASRILGFSLFIMLSIGIVGTVMLKKEGNYVRER